jgi:hypothetical protein
MDSRVATTDEAFGWLVRQLRWEATLGELHARAELPRSAAPVEAPVAVPGRVPAPARRTWRWRRPVLGIQH